MSLLVQQLRLGVFDFLLQTLILVLDGSNLPFEADFLVQGEFLGFFELTRKLFAFDAGPIACTLCCLGRKKCQRCPTTKSFVASCRTDLCLSKICIGFELEVSDLLFMAQGHQLSLLLAILQLIFQRVDLYTELFLLRIWQMSSIPRRKNAAKGLTRLCGLRGTDGLSQDTWGGRNGQRRRWSAWRAPRWVRIPA